jgi:hypothetical protein
MKMEVQKGEPKFLYGTTYDAKEKPRQTTACVIPINLAGIELYAVGLTRLNPKDTPDKDTGDTCARDRANEVADAYMSVIAKYANTPDTKILTAAELGDLEKLLQPVQKAPEETPKPVLEEVPKPKVEVRIVPASESDKAVDSHD